MREMSIQDSLILKREWVVVPRASRSKLLKGIHSSHIGVNGCLNRVHECVFWLMCHVGHVLTMFQPARPVENLNGFKQRKRWCSLRRQLDPSNELQPTCLSLKERLVLGYLRLLLDFFEFDHLRSVSSVYVIRKLKADFASHGIPKQLLVTVNSLQFTSCDFLRFTEECDFEHLMIHEQPSSQSG